MPTVKKGRPSKEKMSSDSTFFTLDELGLSRDQSSTWQKIAAVADETSMRVFEDCREHEREITQAELLYIAKRGDKPR